MLLELDFSHDVPIYMQIRNQVVMGIADGRLSAGEKLPPIRALANETGINMMTASKAYALLKQEGYIQTDRRSGAVVCVEIGGAGLVLPKLQQSLKLLIAEAMLSGVHEEDFLRLCRQIYSETEGAK
ncbi:MAG: GntR family transcriptional regulator [Clostridiales bacterium]|nr:GntR family transcriptional regulator [Clostridiales bacterium]